MRQVSKDEFFKAIFDRKLDVHPRIANDRWPYTVVWEFPRQPGRPVFGESMGLADGSAAYFVAA